MRLTRCQDKVEKAPSGIANTDDFTAKAASRTTEGLGIAAAVAIESQTHMVGLLGRAPAAFWCARATVPSMQAKASFGSP